MNKIDIVKEFESEMPIVMGDFSRIQQVFLNLLNNAVYAMQEAHKKGKFTIRTKIIPNASGNKEILRIEFEDDGPGIPKEIRHRIFEPFFTTKKEKGTGLGLSISNEIIREHKGRMWVESPVFKEKDKEIGIGTRFVIEMPCFIEHTAVSA